ncbi:MAG: ribonuclease E activity regulator RraA [Pseudomonadota bacterium]|nr:ribonuclease E activity regulator RraA [Pseudomonadota bacterium]
MALNMGIIRTADICDEHKKEVQVCEIEFKDYAKRHYFHGQVVTFSTFEDNKSVRDVLGKGGAGKVLVVDGRGSRRRALCGGNIAREAYEKGWEGIVCNGCIRDQHEILDLDFGVKAIGASPMRPRKDGIAKLSVQLFFGGVVINHGDYLYADQDGIVIAAKKLHK